MKYNEKTIALRFADTFAPKEGTVNAHIEMIKKCGFVWYGKLGSNVSSKVINDIMSNESPRILLIHSGKLGRYWAYVEQIQNKTPDINFIPFYYRNNAYKFNTWFKIVKIEETSKNVLSNCYVLSSGRLLSEVSKSSMSPYFIIKVEE